MLLTHRKQSKAIAIDNDLRGTLRNFGLKVGMVPSGRDSRPPYWGVAPPLHARDDHARDTS
jgi:hypothetical protein